MSLFDIVINQKGDADLCGAILRSLPNWFGIEDSIQDYVRDVANMPMVEYRSEGESLGFLSIKRHNRQSAEIFVMGVLPDFHSQGIGRAMIKETEKYLREDGCKFFQVKTLDESHGSLEYQKTRSFYQAQGFEKLEVFKDLWGNNNPCLLMIKSL